MAERLKIGLILDSHPFDEIAFKRMFDAMIDEIEIFPQLLANYQFDYAGNIDKYDGFIFYNMSMQTPDPEETFPGGHKKSGDTIFKIGESGQGKSCCITRYCRTPIGMCGANCSAFPTAGLIISAM